jgi:hypothetical protein
MFSWRLLAILTIVASGSGLLLTLISGVYVVKPFTGSADTSDYGFPLAWFEAVTTLHFLDEGGPTYHSYYFFFWQGFIFDFLLYGLFIACATIVYFVARMERGIIRKISCCTIA